MPCYLLLLQIVWAREGRYLLPLYPMLVFGWLHGVRSVTEFLRREWPQSRVNRVAVGVGASVAVMSAVLLLRQEPRTGGDLTELPETQALFGYLTGLGDQQATKVAFNKARVLVWHTGIEAVSLPNAAAEIVLPELERLGITHVILDRLGLNRYSTRSMEETIAANACRFQQTFQNGSFDVYRFLPECSRTPQPTAGWAFAKNGIH